MGVDLARVKGSGIGGRVTAADVKSAAASGNGRGMATPVDRPPRHAHKPSRPAESPAKAGTMSTLPEPEAPPFAVGGEEETITIPFRGVRRTIANRLRDSVDKAVHFGVMDEADVTALDGLRRRLAAASGEKISLLPFVCCAVARTLAGEFGYQLNRLNSTTDDEKGEITQYRTVNLGIATDTPAGLMVPVIRNATRLGVLEMGRKIAQLASAARDRSIPMGDLQGSTFTISNFGSYAGRFASPIINYPEAGILAVGRMREGVVVKHGMLGVGKLLPLSLVSDHRVIDGGTATLFLNKIVELLQNPDVLLPTNLQI
jgi:pyruvate dehydrogenase E2 component (dihydrolipoamide acetyltransferase)